jgi:RimJ/RimL family protein N-acetyltransferase
LIRLPSSEAEKSALLAWASERIGHQMTGDAFGVTRRGALAAVVVFHNREHTRVSLSMASDDPHWSGREVFRLMAQYAFGELGVKVVVCTIDKMNKRCRRLAEGGGFQYQGKVPDGAPEGDVCIYTFHESQLREWRYAK